MRTSIQIGFILLLILFGCNPKKVENTNKTYMVICFDVEDYTSPESVGMDDIPKWLAEILTDEGVTGSFFVIGEKARVMAKRGRKDVIEAMAKHDIGSHTNFGSIHPTVTEILESASWEEGINTMVNNESAGLRELEEIFEKPPHTLARHGGSYGPQLVAALGQLGTAYIYSPVSLPGHNAVWFCNTLNFHGEGDFGFFDDTYYKDELFDSLFQKLDSKIPELTKDIEVISFFANHPSKVRSIQFWDFNYYNGTNPRPEEWKTPELRPLESMENAKKNFRKLVNYLKNRDDIELTTYGRLRDEFSYQKNEISEKELLRIALEVIESRSIVMDKFYSPAEIMAAISSSLSHYNHSGKIPDVVKIRRPFGPIDMPREDPEITEISKDQGLYLANEVSGYIDLNNQLPSGFDIEGKTIGTGSLLALFSEMYTDLTKKSEKDVYQLNNFQAYPVYNEEVILTEVRNCKFWPVHREDLDMSNLVEMTKKQLWTLKPAFTNEQATTFN